MSDEMLQTINEQNDPIQETKQYDFRIITFNLLSPEQIKNSISGYFPFVKKYHIEFSFRAKLAKKLIAGWIKVNFIICLQEVSDEWTLILVPFFKENNYTFHYTVYANGKMGVGIAYPTNHYHTLESRIWVCGDIIKDYYKLIYEKHSREPIKDVSETVMQVLADASELKNPIIGLMVAVKYFGKFVGKNILVATYHMPCRYGDKYLIPGHIHAIKRGLDNFIQDMKSQGIETHGVILAGDFNVTPNNPEYKLLVSDQHIERSRDPAIIIEQTRDPVITIDRTQDPAITIDQTQDPTITIDRTQDPAITIDQTQDPVMTIDRTQDPVISDQSQDPEQYIRVLDSIYREIGEDLYVSRGTKFRSAHASHHGTDPLYTNQSLQLDKKFIGCLDYILISPEIKIRSCMVGLTVSNHESTPYPNGLCPSDHLPVSASLFIK
jgi:mRNA deadenylase 3'-5' endonuclease subunit Ccr4